MNLLIGILMCMNVAGGQDTLRKDGYYITVSDQGANWHIRYFRPDGSYADSSGHGTPPVFEKEMLQPVGGTVYSVVNEKEGFTIRYENINLPPYHVSDKPAEQKCKIENGDLVILAWRNNMEKKWTKVKIRYYFIPF